MAERADVTARRAELRRLGLCTRCGKQPIAPRSLGRCEGCLVLHRGQQRSYRGVDPEEIDMERAARRKRTLEFRSNSPIAEDPDLAAEVARAVCEAGSRFRLRITALTLEHRAIAVTVELPGEVGTELRPEDAHLRTVAGLLAEAIRTAFARARAGEPTLVLPATSPCPHG